MTVRNREQRLSGYIFSAFIHLHFLRAKAVYFFCGALSHVEMLFLWIDRLSGVQVSPCGSLAPVSSAVAGALPRLPHP
jgi:hypothetical protein